MKKKPTRKDKVRDLRFTFGDRYVIRQGRHYIVCQCRACRNLFYVSYNREVQLLCITRLQMHVRDTCSRLAAMRRESVGD